MEKNVAYITKLRKGVRKKWTTIGLQERKKMGYSKKNDYLGYKEKNVL